MRHALDRRPGARGASAFYRTHPGSRGPHLALPFCITEPCPHPPLSLTSNFCGDCPSSDLYTVNPSGGHVRRITSGFGNNIAGRFSPDGTMITFTHEDGPPFDFVDQEIYPMNAAGGGFTNLTNSPQDDLGSDWQPIPGG
jgi:WD40 repeat protein